jgi:DNA primase
MQIDQPIIDEILSRADIVNVIGKYLKLKRSGHNYFACCPFHQEKSPSFAVNSQKQFFHCFGCSESGDVITFIMKYHGLDFIDAVKSLADEYHVHIPENRAKFSKQELQQQKKQKVTLNDTLNQAVQFYRNHLVNSSIASHYLKNRGLSNETVNRFLLGYAPNNSRLLSTLFADYATNKTLVDAGLVITTDNNDRFDRFRDRVMFPIRNTKGNIIGFGGRIIAKGEPKYLNSPETELFNKNQELYGLFEAQKAIRDKNHVIVVEGYMDVITLSQYGIDNVVATMGTAVSEEHIKKLFRLCDDIYYAFDGDNAGQKAAWRALERSIALVSDVKAAHFLFLPPEDDPDSFVRNHGAIKFNQQLTSSSLSLSAFLFKQLSQEVNTLTDEGKAKLISLAKPYIEQTKALALQVMLKRQLANLVELEPGVLESILNNRSRYAFFNSKWNKKQVNTSSRTKLNINILKLIIKTALKHIDWVINYCLPDEISHFSTDLQELVLLLDFINNNYTPDEEINLQEIKNNINFTHINLDSIYNSPDIMAVSAHEFQQNLDHLFGRNKRKVIRIPRIPMKEHNNE